MKNFIQSFFNGAKTIFWDLINSLNTKEGMGFAGRKLTVIAMVYIVWNAHQKITDQKVLESVIMYDEILICLLLGLVTFSQLYKFKNGSSDSKKETPKEQ